VIDHVTCFVITTQSLSGGNDKRLKTSNSERIIPVHPRLAEFGFIQFVDVQRLSPQKKLFPELLISTTGYYSDPFSKWFARFLKKVQANRAKTCFHSFRHCFRDALREARVDNDLAHSLGGWARNSVHYGNDTAEAYGRGFSVSALFSALRKIDYPFLDLSHLIAFDFDPI
jgi:integrase